MNSIYEIETIETNKNELMEIVKLSEINNLVYDRQETIQYGRENDGRRTVVKSITPIYEDNEITGLLYLFELEPQIGVIFNGVKKEIEFYPKEYIKVFKPNNEITLDEKTYRIKNINYDLDSKYLLLKVDLEP